MREEVDEDLGEEDETLRSLQTRISARKYSRFDDTRAYRIWTMGAEILIWWRAS
ncbi:hypothetical protein BY996DRAFT_6528755 [Phakopsora pachyrhizi]|nr:hypothetical protein BY996DRAFT_6528755 [Phakopsora pachyrhizi]